MTKYKIQCPATTFIAVVAVMMWLFSFGGSAVAETYGNSAHGNSDPGYGVNRSTAVCEDWPGGTCQIGDCAHCHDTFDSTICGVNPAMLFKPRNPTNEGSNFCLKCHRGSATVQVGDGITNNDYGATFGGGPAMFGHIRAAFNVSSTYSSIHNLAKVRNYARDNADWGTWVTSDTNACIICHDQHLAQKNFPVEENINGGVKTAVRRGNDVVGYPGDLWGDEPAAAPDYRLEMMSDLMSDWGTTYQAPYYGSPGDPISGPFEPANDDTFDGSNLPNYVWACAETCHRLSVKGHEPVNWQSSSSSEWPGTPSAHGRASADFGGFGILMPPYGNGYDPELQSDGRGDYVLSCTDCHEPHGSTNPTLLRTTVNGVSGLSSGGPSNLYPGGAKWYYWCQACHDLEYHYDPDHPDCVGSEDPLCGLGHPVIWPDAHCGDNVGCHLRSDGDGGNHGYQF
jgi:hypothetical protein